MAFRTWIQTNFFRLGATQPFILLFIAEKKLTYVMFTVLINVFLHFGIVGYVCYNQNKRSINQCLRYTDPKSSGV